MQIQLEFDFWVDASFCYTGRRPIALMVEIGKRKDAAFAALAPNPERPGTLIYSEDFVVAGQKFKVTFGSDAHRYSKKILRVMAIQP